MISREEAHRLLDVAYDRAKWINPEWEPFAKCAEDEKEDFTLFLNLLSKFHPKSLGALDLRFENCSPYRSFTMYESTLGHNDCFMDTIVAMALGPEPEND